MNIKEKITEIRKRKGISQKEASSKAGLSPQAYNYLLNSKNLTMSNFIKLFDSVNCEVEFTIKDK